MAEVKHITNEDRPDKNELTKFHVLTPRFLQWITQPCTVGTLEGKSYEIGPHLEEWEDGYWISWPDDGSAPYPISARYVRDNMKPVSGEQ